MASVDDAIAQAYDDVRSDSSATNWFKAVFDGKVVNLEATGDGGLDELFGSFNDADNSKCAFAYARITTGDEESKRAKFAFIAWTGSSAKIMHKAKMSVVKASVKEVVREFAAEFLYESTEDLEGAAEAVKTTIIKAGGANYMGQSG
eukprot:TRINITY_DN43_c0_g1_i1.p1 TRINITY_DN43_c0_g1~~TRINITY_DN43_c0_g1_i1.p1  ORF type:complete len:147 (+),score=51.26 TRINITY_DN43_c0_g1_i1:29-469(+)